MLTALLYFGPGVVGALATLYLLWRKSQLETKLANTESERDSAVINLNSELDHSSRLSAQILTLQGQNSELLSQLTKSGSTGVFASLLQSRNIGHQDSK